MIFGYQQHQVEPTPGHNQPFIYRPAIPVRVHGPKGVEVVLGLLDTGSDVTVLPAFILEKIGGKYTADQRARFQGIGNQPVTVHYSRVELGLKDVLRWPATVGFLEGRTVAILGYAGFLEYFNATFNTDQHRITLKPNKHFPRTR